MKQIFPEVIFNQRRKLAPFGLFPLTDTVSDRLKELQRQRALAQEQLAWLDREIAAAGGSAPAPLQSAAPVTDKPGPAVIHEQTATAISADEIIAKYKTDASSAVTKVKSGCFLYLLLAFTLLGLGMFALYLHTINH